MTDALHVWVGDAAEAATFDPDDVVTFGRGASVGDDPSLSEAKRITLLVGDAASRHMGTLVNVHGLWYLVVPVANADEQPKRPVQVEFLSARCRSTVDEGGWVALTGGEGVIRPDTVEGIRLRWSVEAPTLEVAARRQNERLARPDEQQRRDVVRPDAAVLAQDPHVGALDAERQQVELAALEDELLYAVRDGVPSRTIGTLKPRALDFIVTAAWLHWRDPAFPILTPDQVAAIWSATDGRIESHSVLKTIQRGLADFSVSLPDPITWAGDRTRTVELLRSVGALRQFHFDWQDLDIEYPEDLPRRVREDGSVGPRRQDARPAGWVRSD